MRFFGAIGFGTSVEKAPGVWDDVIVEHNYYGDVVRAIRNSLEGQKISNDLTVNNSISVVADAYANENFMSIRYIQWSGTRWLVSEVEVQSPRLLLRLGGVYNGPTPPAPDTP